MKSFKSLAEVISNLAINLLSLVGSLLFSFDFEIIANALLYDEPPSPINSIVSFFFLNLSASFCSLPAEGFEDSNLLGQDYLSLVKEAESVVPTLIILVIVSITSSTYTIKVVLKTKICSVWNI